LKVFEQLCRQLGLANVSARLKTKYIKKIVVFGYLGSVNQYKKTDFLQDGAAAFLLCFIYLCHQSRKA